MTSNDHHPHQHGNWPVWPLIAGCLLLDALTPPLLLAITSGPANWFAVISAMSAVGLAAGQVCLLVVTSALSRRTWLGSLLLGILLALAGLGALLIGTILAEGMSSEVIDASIGIGLIPALLMVAAAPLYVFRHLAGWRIARVEEEPTFRQPLGLYDVFTLLTALATAIVLMRAPQVAWEVDVEDYWPVMLVVSAILFGIGLVVLPLCVRFALGNYSVSTSAGAVGGIASLLIAALFGIVQLFYPWQASLNSRFESLPYFLGMIGGAASMFYFGMRVLRQCGYGLIREAKHPSPTQQQGALQRQRRANNWRIAAAIALTMAVSFALVRLQAWRAVKDEHNLELKQLAEETGGSILISDRRVLKLVLGRRATDGGLARYRDCGSLRTLDMTDARITDAGLAELSHFGRLEKLTLDGTKVTDAGLAHLRTLRRLEHLSLEGNDLTGSGLAHLGPRSSLEKLFLVGTNFTDAQSKFLVSLGRLRKLDVSSTQITDDCLQQLETLQRLGSLTANETSITAREFPLLEKLGILSLDDTQVDDQGAASLGRLRSLSSLSLRNTKITNAALHEFGKLQNLMFIAIDGNDIDDEGLRELREVPGLRGIHLSDTRVTGSVFTNWNPARLLSQLTLDRTDVDDTTVKELIKLQPWKELSFSGTKLTDACLPHLAKMSVSRLDLSGTQVTVNGIRASKLRGVDTLTLSVEQLTGVDVDLLRKQLGIDVRITDVRLEDRDN